VTGSTSIIVRAGRGGRPLLQTADSILRSRLSAVRTLLALPAAPGVPLLESVAARLTAPVVHSLEAAVRAVDSRYILIVPAGYVLDDVFVEECESAFARDAAAVAPSLRLQTPDTTSWLEWMPGGDTAAAVLNDTRSVPPVFAVRHDVCQALTGFDDAFEEFTEYDFWLRLTLARHKVAVLEEPLIARDITLAPCVVGPAYPAGHSDDERHLRLFRAVLEKHARAIDTVMHEVLVAREVRFGQLREAHRELTRRRDEGLAELDRLRAEAAHLRAYVAYHGRDEIDWGDLRRTDPISRDWGYDRGIPLDRRYIDEFLAMHSSDVRGSVLEVQEDEFTRAYGGPRVTRSHVLDIDASNARASILADLRCAPGIAPEQFDCIILTQTLHVIDDMAAVLRECHRMLKPGGVLLATLPAASRVCLEYGHDSDLWRATPAGARSLFRTAFAPSTVATSGFGNVLTNVAFLHGVATQEIADAELESCDPYFPALTGVRASKGSSRACHGARGVVLLYHRIEDASGILDLSVQPALFDAQLAWLRHKCNVVPLEALLERPMEALPERAVALTFDDGYGDNLTTVAPLLRKYQLPATFFLTTRWLNEAGEYWWDLLERAGLAESEAARLHDELVHATLEHRDGMLRSIANSGNARVRPLPADEVRQLAAYANVSIGAHSINHLALPDQPAEVVRREIEGSCSALERVIGKPVGLFAYPYGAYDRASAAAVRASCRWGISCDDRPLTESFDAAAVPRLEVKRWDVNEFAVRIESRLRLTRRGSRRSFAGP